MITTPRVLYIIKTDLNNNLEKMMRVHSAHALKNTYSNYAYNITLLLRSTTEMICKIMCLPFLLFSSLLFAPTKLIFCHGADNGKDSFRNLAALESESASADMGTIFKFSNFL